MLMERGCTLTSKGAHGYTALHQVAYTPFSHLCEFILGNGGNLDALSKNGSTPLLIAAREGHPEVVETMLRYGADPNDGGDKGLTPLLMAASEGHLEIVKLLLGFGADARDAPFEGRTALHEAAESGHADVCRVLIEEGASVPTISDIQGNTPLSIAAKSGSEELLSVIKSSKYNPSTRQARKPDQGVKHVSVDAIYHRLPIPTALKSIA